jgi:hypothetical protein
VDTSASIFKFKVIIEGKEIEVKKLISENDIIFRDKSKRKKKRGTFTTIP